MAKKSAVWTLLRAAKSNGFTVKTDREMVSVVKYGATFTVQETIDRRTLLLRLADFIAANSYTQVEDAFGDLYYKLT